MRPWWPDWHIHHLGRNGARAGDSHASLSLASPLRQWRRRRQLLRLVSLHRARRIRRDVIEVGRREARVGHRAYNVLYQRVGGGRRHADGCGHLLDLRAAHAREAVQCAPAVREADGVPANVKQCRRGRVRRSAARPPITEVGRRQ